MNVEACCLPHPEAPGTYLLYVELSAGEDGEAQARKPVHLALAIDSSSSMGGPRLTCAVEAARAVAGRLSSDDIFCLLAFDREVRSLFGPGRVDDHARKAIDLALAQLRPGVGTAIYTALERAYEALRRVFVRGSRPHALVLTDGFPSVGSNDPEAFAALSRHAAEEGIVTSAVGVGLDFDEHSVAAMAAGGGGRYSFVDKESDIPGALARHLSDLFAIAIENAILRVAPATAVREASLLHRYTTRVGPDGFVVETGPIGHGNPRRLLFLLRAPVAPSPMAAKIALSVKGPSKEPNRILSIALDPDAPAAQEAIRELHRLELSSRESAFWEAVHHGDRAAALHAFADTEKALDGMAKTGASKAELDADRMRLVDEKAVLDGRLSAEARAAARKRSHQTAISRVTSIFDD